MCTIFMLASVYWYKHLSIQVQAVDCTIYCLWYRHCCKFSCTVTARNIVKLRYFRVISRSTYWNKIHIIQPRKMESQWYNTISSPRSLCASWKAPLIIIRNQASNSFQCCLQVLFLHMNNIILISIYKGLQSCQHPSTSILLTSKY